MEQSQPASLEESQQELGQKLLESLVERYKSTGSISIDDEETQQNDPALQSRLAQKAINCYQSTGRLPSHLSPHRLFVDRVNECLIIPINGTQVPFHISLIKSCSYTKDVGSQQLNLSIEFSTPPSTTKGLSSRAMKRFFNPISTFVKTINVKGTNLKHFEMISDQIKQLKATHKSKVDLNAEKSKIVETIALETLPASQVPRLLDVKIRPTPAGGKARSSGTLQAQKNSFRFLPHAGPSLVINYSNIAHAFFHPSKNDIICAIHLYLKKPMRIGKSLSKHVQFYVQVAEASVAIGDFQSDFGAESEESRERQRVLLINRQFQEFVRASEKITTQYPPQLQFQFPLFKLEFEGVYDKKMSKIYPTPKCFLSITDSPYFVVPFEEIEFAYFERFRLDLREFDLVLIRKNYHAPVVRINTIPQKLAVKIQKILNNAGLRFYKGGLNVPWKSVLNDIMADPKEFLDTGGWEKLAFDLDDVSESDSDHPEDYSPDQYSPSDSSYEDSDEAPIEEEAEWKPESDDEDVSWDEITAQAEREDRARGVFMNENGLPEGSSSTRKSNSRVPKPGQNKSNMRSALDW